MQKEKVLFYQDNAPCHKSMKTVVKLNELHFQLLDHPACSPDLAPRSICRPQKNPLGKRIWLQWRNDWWGCRLFWKRIQIVRVHVSLFKPTVFINKVKCLKKKCLLIRFGTYWIICYLNILFYFFLGFFLRHAFILWFLYKSDTFILFNAL